MTEAATDVERWGVPEAVAMVEVCSAVVLAEELSPVVAGLVPVLPYYWGQLKEKFDGIEKLVIQFRTRKSRWIRKPRRSFFR